MQHAPRWTAFICAAALAACRSGTEPTSTNLAPSLDRDGGGRVVQSATGAGHFTIGGELRTFAFTAQKHADGSVTGQYQLINRASDARVHGEVTCLSVVGNRAWIGGVQKNGSEGFPEGLENGFRVVDNGEGANDPPDQLSLMFVNAPPGFAQAYCNARPAAPPLFPIEGGNIQVRD